MTRFAYLHGFASSPDAAKATHLARVFEQHGLTLDRPDLNRPSFEKLSTSAMLSTLDAHFAGEARHALCLIGSSLGGWLAARWAEQHPSRVIRLVLLCPGFDLASRWPRIFGQTAFNAWQRDRALLVPDARGNPAPLHYAFYEEMSREPPFPEVPCPTLIIHGTRDATVPIESSRAYAAARPDKVHLVEVDDDHALVKSIDIIERETLSFFGIETEP